MKNLQENFAQRKQKLLQYHQCRQVFAELLNSQKILNNEIEQHQKQYNQVKQNLQIRIEDKKQLDKKLLDIKAIYEKKETLLSESVELNHIIAIRKALSEKKRLDERIEKGDSIIREQKLALKENSLELSKQKEQLQQDKDKLANIKQLNAIKTFYIQQQHIEQNLYSLKQESERLEKQLISHHEQQKKAIPESFYVEKKQANISLMDYDFIRASAQTWVDSLSKTKQQIEEEKHHLFAQEKLKQWADSLEDGKPCPVCGAAEHPHVLNLADLNSKMTRLKKQDEKLDNEIKRHLEIISLMNNGQFETNTIEASLSNSQIKIEQLLQQLNTHYKSFDSIIEINSADKLYKHEEITLQKETQQALNSVEALLKEAEQQQKNIKQLENNILQLDKTHTKLQQNIDKYSLKHQELKDQFISLDTTIKNTQQLLKLYSLEQLDNEADEVLVIMLKSKVETAKQAELDFDKISRSLDKLSTSVNQLEGQEKTLAIFLQEQKNKSEKNQKLIDKELFKSDYADIGAIQSILNSSINEVVENQEINDFEIKLSIATSEHEKLQSTTKDKIYDKHIFIQLTQALADDEKELQQLGISIGAIRQSIKQLKVDLSEKKILENVLLKLTKKNNNISILTKLFKGQGFVKYISTVYLQNLSSAANKRFFKMTNQQLQLEVNDNNDFQIRDFLNEGKTRSVKTLSGGQLFQASLSLALALADSVQSQLKSNQHFFFLDEGFGSLDNSALHIVFNALKSLKMSTELLVSYHMLKAYSKKLMYFVVLIKGKKKAVSLIILGTCKNIPLQ